MGSVEDIRSQIPVRRDFRYLCPRKIKYTIVSGPNINNPAKTYDNFVCLMFLFLNDLCMVWPAVGGWGWGGNSGGTGGAAYSIQRRQQRQHQQLSNNNYQQPKKTIK